MYCVLALVLKPVEGTKDVVLDESREVPEEDERVLVLATLVVETLPEGDEGDIVVPEDREPLEVTDVVTVMHDETVTVEVIVAEVHGCVTVTVGN